LSSLSLQTLVYCGVPLRAGTWPVLVAAVAGIALVGRHAARRGSAQVGMNRDLRMIAIVLLLGMLGQSPALISSGPERFYGTGSYDQETYVSLAEFLVGLPLDLRGEDIGHRPWLATVWQVKETRLTQSVLLGATAVATRTSAQEAYGVVNIFLIAWVGVALAGGLRTAGLRRFPAACAGLVAVFSPALTRVHLEGYFSQTASLFVLPALIGVLGTKGPWRQEMGWQVAVLLAYLIGAYTEMAVVGVALFVLLMLLRRDPWRVRIRAGVLIGIGALALNPGYLSRLVDFLLLQWRMAKNPDAMAGLFPDSGTWVGWGRLFFSDAWPAASTGIGLAVIGLAMAGGGRFWRAGRPAVPAACWLTVLVLGAVWLQPQFSKYIFAKFCIEFVPLWSGAAAGVLLSRSGAWSRGRNVLAALAVVLVWGGAWSWHQRVIRAEGVLSELASERMLRVRHEAEAHPERAYLVACDDPVVAGWLCYHGRRSPVTVERRTVGDRLVTTEGFIARRWMDPAIPLHWLDLEKSGPVQGYEPAPTLTVTGAKESGENGGTGGGRFYLAAPALELILHRRAGATVRAVWLDFVAVPVQPGDTCHLELADATGRRWALDVGYAGWCRWPLQVPAGESAYRLTVSGKGGALIKLLSIETAAELPAWQHVSLAVPLAGPR